MEQHSKRPLQELRSETVAFGTHRICPRCRAFTGKAYKTMQSRKTITVSREVALIHGYRIKWAPPGSKLFDSVTVVCPDCDGTGITKGLGDMFDIPKALAAAQGLDDRLLELLRQAKITNALLAMQLLNAYRKQDHLLANEIDALDNLWYQGIHPDEAQNG